MATAGEQASTRKRARREPMSRVDTAWLRMERPTNPMMITGVLMFAEPMSLERAQARGQAALPRLPALPPEGRRHAGRRVLARPTTTSTSTGTCSTRRCPGAATSARWSASSASSRRRRSTTTGRCGSSTWSRRYDGGSALVARIHHSYADGIALVQVLLSLTDTAAATPDEGQRTAARLAQAGRTPRSRAASAPSTAT